MNLSRSTEHTPSIQPDAMVDYLIESRDHLSRSINPEVKNNAAKLAYIHAGRRQDTNVDLDIVYREGIRMSRDRLESLDMAPTDRYLASSLFFEFFNVLDDQYDEKTKTATGEVIDFVAINPETGKRTAHSFERTNAQDLFRLVLRDRTAFTSEASKREQSLSPEIAGEAMQQPETELEISGYELMGMITGIIADSEEYTTLEKMHLLGDQYLEAHLKGQLEKETDETKFGLLMQDHGQIAELVKAIMLNIATYGEAARSDSKAAFLLRYGTITDYFSTATEIAFSSKERVLRDAYYDMRKVLLGLRNNSLKGGVNIIEQLPEEKREAVRELIKASPAEYMMLENLHTQEEVEQYLAMIETRIEEPEDENDESITHYGRIAMLDMEQARTIDQVVDAGMTIQIKDDIEDLLSDLNNGVSNPILAVLRETGLTDRHIKVIFKNVVDTDLYPNYEGYNPDYFARDFMFLLNNPPQNWHEDVKTRTKQAYEKIKTFFEMSTRSDVSVLEPAIL